MKKRIFYVKIDNNNVPPGPPLGPPWALGTPLGPMGEPRGGPRGISLSLLFVFTFY